MRLQLVAPLSWTSELPTLKIRTYPHFDGALTEQQALRTASDPSSVAAHAFYPFIEYPERWTKFARKGFTGAVKSRPIKYSSRIDSCIYSYYRELLREPYETKLNDLGISAAVLAYRRIAKTVGSGNKCNIHFAKDAFDFIRSRESCRVYAFDIKSFFDNLDHQYLKRKWASLLDKEALPKDHFAVFRNITRFGWVDRETVYKRVGIIGPKTVRGRQVEGYLTKRIPMQICTPANFREQIKPLIRYNSTKKGIPQGSPISDLLANLYLLDFDKSIFEYALSKGGKYFRYSDDILLVLPDDAEGIGVPTDFVQEQLQLCGGSLSIQAKKTTVHRFWSVGGQLSFSLLQGSAGKNGLEYLGFRFDGRKTFIRDSTRSRLQRKMTFAVRAQVNELRRQNPSAGRASLKSKFDVKAILEQFHHVREFRRVAKSPTDWTFWTYLIRSTGAFGEPTNPIAKQFKRFRRSIKRKAEKLIDKTVSIP